MPQEPASIEDARGPLSAPRWPLVTVNVLSFNRCVQLRRTLQTLLALDYPRDRLEVIVVDNASADRSVEMVRTDFPHVRVIERRKNGGIAGWNAGFAVGEGDFFLVLDDDCYIAGDALKRAVEAARAAGADLTSFYVESLEPGHSFSEYSKTGLLSFWGCAALISRRGIERLGGYDENIFIWAHELEFTMRLLDAGLRHLYLPQVLAVHQKVPTGFRLEMHQRNMRNFAYISAKLLQPRDSLQALANLTLRVLMESAQRPEVLACLRDVWQGARAGLVARHPIGPEVSRLYRRNCVEFVNHVRFVRGPIARWRGRGNAPELELQRRRDSFYHSRPQLHPSQQAVLEV